MANEFKVKNGLIVSGSADFEQDLRVRGTLTVDELHTSITTSSIIYESGSTVFGNSSDDIHVLTGSVKITGSISLNGEPIGTGKLNETTFETFTSSYIIHSGSFDTRIDNLESFSSSLDINFVSETEFGSYTSSANTRLNFIETSTGSLNQFSSSINTFTSSINTTINDIINNGTLVSGSSQVEITGTTGYSAFSSSIATTDLNQNNRLDSLETASGSIRTDFNSFTSSYTTVSGSLDSRLDVLEAYSGSQLVPSSSMSFRTLQTDVYCKNMTGVQINKGKVVRVINALGDNPLIALADYTSEQNSANSLGITIEDIPHDSFGSVITQGILTGVNTSGMTAGALLFLGTSGSFTTSPPVAPNHGVRLGEVLRVQQNQGSILVNIDNGMELSEAHDVRYTNITSGDLLVRNGNGVWNNSKNLTGSYYITGSLNASGIVHGSNITAIETSTASLNSFSSSTISRLDSIESSTSSLNTYTSSTNTRLNIIETSTGSLNTYTSSANVKFSNIENVTSSFASYSGSTNTRLDNIETSTGSLNSFTSSTNTILSSIETSTGSLNSFTSSINTTIKNKLNSDGVISGSAQVTLSSTTGYSTFSSSLATTDAGQDTRLTSLEGKTGSYATTGSNIFIGNQIITGSLYISQDLVIAGSSSIQHISSSVVNIADNIITVNAQNPSIRFGGLAVIDSGSSPQVSGSMLFDSTNDQWVFVHQNQSVVTSSILLMGPQTFNNLGNETYPTTNRILKSLNAEHIGDSNITDTGTKVSINSDTEVTGSIKSTSDITAATNLVSNFSSGDEGGEINLNKPVTNTTLSSGITIDVWRDRLRIFESGGTNRGGFFNIAGLSTGASTNFLSTAETASFVEYSNIANKPTLVSGSSQINHNTTTNYDANQHVDHTAVSITAGNGLSGGGTIAATRTLTLDTGSTHFTNGVKSKMNTDGVVSGSSQITYGSISGIPSGIVSGSSQVLNGTTIHSGSFFNGITVVSGSGQISFGGITGVPSGLVSGSSQVSYTGLSNIPSGIVSGSSQISFGSISGVPSGLVSGSSQITNIANSQLTNSSFNIGTTSISLGRASSAQTLSGVNIDGYSTQLNGYSNQTVHTILTGPANGPVWKVRYDSATANRYVDLGFQDGNGVYYEGLKIYNGAALTWLTYTVLHSNNYNSYSPTLTGGGASGTWGISISGNAATVTNGVYTTGDQTISGTKTFAIIRGDSGTDSHTFTNTDSGNTYWTNRGGRLLTSNGSNWASDGKDPIIAIVGSTSATTRGRMIGLTLHNDDTTNNAFSPMISFSSRSDSGSYNTVYASISGRKTGYGSGLDTNWAKGELHFYCHGDNYVADTPTLRMTATNSTFNTSITATGEILTSYTNGINTINGGSGYAIYRAYGNSDSVEVQLGAHQTSGYGTVGTYSASNFGIKTSNVVRAYWDTSGHLLPNVSGTYNLGSSSARWNTVFTSDLSMSNGIGDYTIVEGEEDLFIYNNKTNKVFKFLLQEVDPAIAPAKKI